jgi:hypothetical protein
MGIDSDSSGSFECRRFESEDLREYVRGSYFLSLGIEEGQDGRGKIAFRSVIHGQNVEELVKGREWGPLSSVGVYSMTTLRRYHGVDKQTSDDVAGEYIQSEKHVLDAAHDADKALVKGL